jgi:arginase
MAARAGEEHIKVISVPTEAGTHFPGQCKAPEALIKTGGLLDKLQSIGYTVSTYDDLLSDAEFNSAAPWSPSPKINGVRNETKAVAVMNRIKAHLPSAVERDTFPIIIGGDCSITPAVLSSLHSTIPADQTFGLLYIDGDADLTLPDQTDADGSTAIMDSMCMTHLTGRAGGLESMRAFARPDSSPLITPNNIVLFGFDPLQPATEHWSFLLEKGFKAFTQPTVQRSPVVSAKEAIAWLNERVDVIFVHFDVDVIDSGQFPLANYPHYNGLGIDQAMAVLDQVLSTPEVKSLTITEVNPNNDPNGRMVQRIVEGVVHGMARRQLH